MQGSRSLLCKARDLRCARPDIYDVNAHRHSRARLPVSATEAFESGGEGPQCLHCDETGMWYNCVDMGDARIVYDEAPAPAPVVPPPSLPPQQWDRSSAIFTECGWRRRDGGFRSIHGKSETSSCALKSFCAGGETHSPCWSEESPFERDAGVPLKLRAPVHQPPLS